LAELDLGQDLPRGLAGVVDLELLGGADPHAPGAAVRSVLSNPCPANAGAARTQP